MQNPHQLVPTYGKIKKPNAVKSYRGILFYKRYQLILPKSFKRAEDAIAWAAEIKDRWILKYDAWIFKMASKA
jgi:hypothetical protein